MPGTSQVTRVTSELAALLRQVEAEGQGVGDPRPLGRIQDTEEGAVFCCLWTPASDLAQRLSTLAGGQWWVGKGALTWVSGRRVGYLLDWARVPVIEEARRAAVRLMGEVRSWSLGGIAKGLLKWIGAPSRHYRCTEAALGGLPWGYALCRPGSYADQRFVDLDRCYHQVLCRMPSPRLTWLPSGPIWHPLATDERERWTRLLIEVAGAKALRVALNGSMCGSVTPPEVYCRGERLKIPRAAGPFRSAGLLAVRTAYELTYLQAREGAAVYANTDSLILPSDRRLSVWDAYGYSWREEARGEADIRCLDVYRVGERSTHWYQIGARYPVPLTNRAAPSTLTLRAWH